MSGISVHLNTTENDITEKLGLASGEISIHFGDGTHYSGYSYTLLAHMLTEGFKGYYEDIPARPLFSAFTQEQKEHIIQIVKSSYALRFKRIKSKEQFTIAAGQIRDYIVELVKTGKIPILPKNSSTWSEDKGGLPPWVYTGELIDSLEGTYEPK